MLESVQLKNNVCVLEKRAAAALKNNFIFSEPDLKIVYFVVCIFDGR